MARAHWKFQFHKFHLITPECMASSGSSSRIENRAELIVKPKVLRRARKIWNFYSLFTNKISSLVSGLLPDFRFLTRRKFNCIPCLPLFTARCLSNYYVFYSAQANLATACAKCAENLMPLLISYISNSLNSEFCLNQSCRCRAVCEMENKNVGQVKLIFSW